MHQSYKHILILIFYNVLVLIYSYMYLIREYQKCIAGGSTSGSNNSRLQHWNEILDPTRLGVGFRWEDLSSSIRLDLRFRGTWKP